MEEEDSAISRSEGVLVGYKTISGDSRPIMDRLLITAGLELLQVRSQVAFFHREFRTVEGVSTIKFLEVNRLSLLIAMISGFKICKTSTG